MLFLFHVDWPCIVPAKLVIVHFVSGYQSYLLQHLIVVKTKMLFHNCRSRRTKQKVFPQYQTVHHKIHALPQNHKLAIIIFLLADTFSFDNTNLPMIVYWRLVVQSHQFAPPF